MHPGNTSCAQVALRPRSSRDQIEQPEARRRGTGRALIAARFGGAPTVILTDNETRVDLLNNEAIATTIVELLRERPDRPVTIGVHGDWGAGKSSILEMIDAGLSSNDNVLCIKFNGWRFQGFEDAKIALIEGIVTGLIGNPRQPGGLRHRTCL